MGLFDSFKDFDLNSPQGQGIMALAANLLAARDQPGASLGGALGRGALAGMGAYTDAIQGQRRSKLQDMQLKQYEQQIADANLAREEKQAIKKAYKNALAPKIGGGLTSGGLLSGDYSPEYTSQMPSQKEIQQNLFKELSQIAPEQALQYLPQAPKVKQYMEIAGPQGEKLYQGVDEQGQMVGQPMNAYMQPVQVNTGGSVRFEVPRAGMNIPVGMSPAERDASARGWASNSLAKQRLAIDASNMLGAKLPSGYYMEGGTAKPIPGTEAATKAQDAVRAKQSDMDTAMRTLDTIQQLRTHPGRQTGTGLSSRLAPTNYIPGTDAYDFGALVDQAKSGAFLQGAQALRGMGALTESEGKKVESAVARMNTAQSEGAFLKALDEYESIVKSGLNRAGFNAGAQKQNQGGIKFLGFE